jgi:hypothetical protein
MVRDNNPIGSEIDAAQSVSGCDDAFDDQAAMPPIPQPFERIRVEGRSNLACQESGLFEVTTASLRPAFGKRHLDRIGPK